MKVLIGLLIICATIGMASAFQLVKRSASADAGATIVVDTAHSDTATRYGKVPVRLIIPAKK